jgi:hypothetical protein
MEETEFIITNFWQIIASGAVSVVITLIVFWAGIVRNMITKEEVCEMLDSHSPYMRDRQMIMDRLAMNKDMLSDLSKTLKQNAEVMTELKIQIAMLSTTLEIFQNKMTNERD